ncbi:MULTISPECIES: PGAP1-like alpha/beta domain-containing protein [Nocardia]|uniref:PGAP1-like alpha/beta domain-containing protein n=1 Tax=Nocardia TaxID=1817 RepID=UPI000D68591C|nr:MULTISPECIES: alpha/beta fold hydrolase [Nocardia]
MSGTHPQRKAEVRALARLAGDELGGAVDGIGAVHRAISDRVFAAVRLGVGPAAQPVKLVHDAITDGVYRAVSAAAVAAGAVAEHTADVPGVAPSRTVYGSGLLAALQGLIGDTLADQRPILAGPMTFRRAGAPIAAEQVAAGLTRPSGHIVVFLHGLVETEHAWHLGGGPSYAERLDTDMGCSALQIRYNSGLRIHDNAAQLSELMQRLVDHWPVPVERISLVGHSMGGLIVRGACFEATEAGRTWVRAVRKVVCLGSPHLGAPLEQVVHHGSSLLGLLPETRPFGRLLRRRSAGIRDLRRGSVLEDAEAADIPLLEGVDHYFVTASITRSPRNPLGRVLGDGLVLTPSGAGRNRSRRIGFEESNGLHLPGANHFTLLNHEAVYAALRDWLGASEAARADSTG